MCGHLNVHNLYFNVFEQTESWRGIIQSGLMRVTKEESPLAQADIEHDMDTSVDRRDFLRMIGAVSLPMAAQACTMDESEGAPEVEFRALNPIVETSCRVLRARSNQRDLISKSEHVSVDPAFLDYLNIGDQCRITRSTGEFAIYTVSETRNEKNDDRMRMGMGGRCRLGTTGTISGTFSTRVVSEGLSIDEAKAAGEMIELLVDDGQSSSLIALAPHGGWIEKYTDDQAEQLQALLAAKGASAWGARGYKTGGGTYNRWHITSTDISRNSFPMLDTVADRGFSYAVSFHGSSHDIVVIGGGAPEELRLAVRDAIAPVLEGSGIEAHLSTAVDLYSGDNPDNIVNWMTADGLGGVQIEQGIRAREGYGEAIVLAVAELYDQLI